MQRKNMSVKFKNGNRLAVPEEVEGAHFFYKTSPVELNVQYSDLVTAAALKHVENVGLNPAEIVVLRHAELEAQIPGAKEAFGYLLDEMSEGIPGSNRSAAGVLVSEWANPHIDSSFEGYAFFSQVLHTGPEPYIMQTFHTFVPAKGSRKHSMECSTRVLNKGDAFMFDPTTAHMVAPRRPGEGQLLVMLQLVISESDAAEREALVSQFAPLVEDKDEYEVFNGY
jgi:hypothetical protein